MKENILEIEFQKVFGYIYAWQITKNKIKESEISYNGAKIVENKICLWNKFEKVWERKSSMTLLSESEKRRLEDFVNYVNKYCNKQRWRAENNKTYYYINEIEEIYTAKEIFHPLDDSRYEVGNYFKTEKEAEEVLEKLKEFWKTIREEMEK